MYVRFWLADHLAREHRLARVVGLGVEAHGDTYEARAKLGPPQEVDAEGVDCAMFVGVKNRKLFDFYRDRDIPVVYMDKPYFRATPKSHPTPDWIGFQYWHWRVSLNAHQPLEFLANEQMKPERWEELGVSYFQTWYQRRKTPEGPRTAIFAGSSAKYHEFHGLPEPTEFARQVMKEMRQHTDKEIVYRPKPSWHEAVPIDGTRFERGKKDLPALLREAHVLVTHGSSACVDAVLAGVPTVVLGDAVTRHISSTSLAELEHPKCVRLKEVERLYWNLAWCQFTMDEFRDGTFWQFMRPRVEASRAGV